MMINFFIEYLYTLIYVVALSYVISLTYPYIRKENMLRNIMVILSYTFVLNIVTYTSPHNGWLYVIGNLMCISLDFIYCGVLVKRFRLNNLFITTIYYSIQIIVGSVMIAVALEIFDNTYLDIVWGSMRVVFPLGNYISSALICKYAVQKRDFVEHQLPKKFLYSFCLINIVEVIIVLILDVLSVEQGDIYIFFILILAGVQMILVNNYIINSSRMYLRNKELELANYSYATTRRHISELEKEQERLYKFKHDINNHLQVLEEVVETESVANQYLKAIKEDLNAPVKLIRTGNIFVDACLNAKIRNNDEVNYVVDAVIDRNVNIAQDKLCSLLFNLIDNATEAALKTAEKIVEIKIFSKGNMLLISIINSTNRPLNYESKKGRDHGKGLIIIKEVVETYHGTMEYFYENNKVHCDILLNVDN